MGILKSNAVTSARAFLGPLGSWAWPALGNARPSRRSRLPGSMSHATGTTASLSRTCRFEQVEHRCLLSAAPIQIGAVYFEDSVGADEAGDVFEITWTGGAPGTQLTSLVIDTDKLGDGRDAIDTFFDVEAGGPGVSGHSPMTIIDHPGIDSVNYSVTDGGMRLEMTFVGFDPGERLTFSIDVDEEGLWSANPIAEGAEFEASHLIPTFEAEHFHSATGSAMFWDTYDTELAAAGLDLPPDNYMPPSDIPRPDQTAGAFLPLTQEPLPISISGTVFEDVDLDNIFDSGEPGIGGVELTLMTLDGDEYVSSGRTTLTNNDGEYRFEDLLPDTYQVVETQPSGYFSIGAIPGTVDGSTRGVVSGQDVISEITLLGGEDSVHNDFGEALPGQLSGNVYHDADDDGQFDGGETGIGGAIVSVQYLPSEGPAPPPDVVYTEPDGSWAVDGLMPGDYRVEEITPAGYFDGLDTAGTLGGTAHNPGDSITGIHLNSGQSGEEYNFGEIVPSSISGRVIADANANGVFDAGDHVLPGVTVHLRDASGSLMATIQTDAQGRYSFDRLTPGVYGVEEIQPEGYFDSVDVVGSEGGTLLAPDSIIDITLVSATDAVSYDFFEIMPSSICGRVIVDANGNGSIDPGEQTMPGVTVHLVNEQGLVLESTETDSTGRYCFIDLPPGVYGVREIQPEGYFDGADLIGSEGGLIEPPDSMSGIALVSGTKATEYDFLELLPVSISGYVYEDDDNDGNRDSNEAPIAGVQLELLDAGGERTGVTTTTDSTGFYRFDGLEPGKTYGVVEEQPTGYHDGTDTAGTSGGVAHNPGDSITGAMLIGGKTAEEYNFGELRPASISGRVHGELNGDCIPDPGEPLLAGVTIYLLDASGNRIDSTLTDSQGEYSFRNLEPGIYGVEEIQPEGYLQGVTHVGSAGGELLSADLIAGADLGPGVNGLDYNFCEAVPASISGYVFQDGAVIKVDQGDEIPDPATLRDGKLTSDDQRLAGVVLTLGDGSGAPVLDAGGHTISTTTDKNGYYEFTGLARGIYTVLETQPGGLIDSIDTAGSKGGIAVNPSDEIDPFLLNQLAVDPKDDAIIRIPIGMGDEAVSYNFSEVRVEEVPPYIPPIPPHDPPSPPVTRSLSEAPMISKVVYTPSPSTPGRFLGGGGGYTPSRSWHLSIINAGGPRDESGGVQLVSNPASIYFDPASWTGSNLDSGEWTIANSGDNPNTTFVFGIAGAIPLTGDFNGDGVDEVAVFIDGHWFIDLNGNGIWDSGDLWANLGNFGDLPVTGDWDGDGKTDIGIFGMPWSDDVRAIEIEPGLPDAQNHTIGSHKNIPPAQTRETLDVRVMKKSPEGRMRADVIDHVFRYGSENDIPISGDFNGDGVTNIGLYRRGTWYLDIDGDGRWSKTDVYIENFGTSQDLPVVGDFNGDGIDQLGIFSAGTWRLDTNGDRKLDDSDEVRRLGDAADKPVVGDFDGDGIDEIAVYRSVQTNADAQGPTANRATGITR